MADWEDTLDQFFAEADDKRETGQTTDLTRFIHETAVPALEQVRGRMARHGREMSIRETDSSATATVQHNGAEEFSYRLHGRQFTHAVLPYAEIRYRERKGLKIIRIESMLRSGAQDYRIEDLAAEEVIRNFLDHYMRAVKPA